MTRDCKNPFLPQPAPDCRYGIRKGHILLPWPVDYPQTCVPLRQLGVEHGYHAVQTKQARCYPQYGLGTPTTCGFRSQVGTHFLERGFDRPAAGKRLDDRLPRQAHVGGKEVVVAVRPRAVVHIDPHYLRQAFAGLVPVGEAADDLDVASATTIPSHIELLAVLGFADHLSQRGQLGTLDARPASRLFATHYRRRFRAVRRRVEAADPRPTPAPFGRRACQLVRAVAAIAGKDKVAVGKPTQHYL